MPRPKKGEKRNKFVSRAVPQLMEEGLDQRQAVGKAEGMFSYYSGGKRRERKFKKLK